MITTTVLILSLRMTYEVPVSYQYTVQNRVPLLTLRMTYEVPVSYQYTVQNRIPSLPRVPLSCPQWHK